MTSSTWNMWWTFYWIQLKAATVQCTIKNSVADLWLVFICDKRSRTRTCCSLVLSAVTCHISLHGRDENSGVCSLTLNINVVGLGLFVVEEQISKTLFLWTFFYISIYVITSFFPTLFFHDESPHIWLNSENRTGFGTKCITCLWIHVLHYS